MKAALLVLFILPSIPRAQNIGPNEGVISVKDFTKCGFESEFAGNKVLPECFQSLQNAVLDQDYSMRRRNGYAAYNTACAGSQPIRGEWSFYGTDGSKYIVFQSSSSMFYSQGDGTCKAITGLNGGLSSTALMSCVQAMGKLWCTDGTDSVFNTDIASTNTISGAPLGTLIGFFRNRIAIGDVSANQTSLYLSGELDGTDWTIPAVQVSTSPAIIKLNGINDGLPITCLLGEYQNGFYIGRDYDLWLLSGYSNQDFTLSRVDQQIGCMDSRSPQMVNNTLMWLSHRGAEQLTGTQINWVSYPIDPTLQTIISAAGNSQSFTVNNTNFSQGNISASGPQSKMSLTISPGNIVPSSWSVTENSGSQYVLGTLNNVSTIAVPGSVSFIQSSSAAFLNAGGELANNTTNWVIAEFSTSTDSSMFGSIIFNQNNEITCPGRLRFTISGNTDSVSSTVFLAHGQGVTPLSLDTSQFRDSSVKIIVIGDCSPAPCIAPSMESTNFIRGTSMSMEYKDVATGAGCRPAFDIDESHIVTSGTYTTQRYDTGFSTPTWGTLTAAIVNSSQTSVSLQTRVSSDSVAALDVPVSVATGTKIGSAEKEFLVVVASFSVNSATETAPSLSDISLLAATTGYYITPCVLVSSPSSWGNLAVNAVTNGGSFSFWVSTGATCSISTATNANWTAQTANSVISVTTTTDYVAGRVLFSVDIASEVPTLNNMDFQWNNGGQRPNVAASEYQNKYFLFYTTSTASGSFNDHALVYDRNGHWQLMDDINAASSVLYLNQLYLGDSKASGKAYIYDSGQSDNGGSFTFGFKTADLDAGDPMGLKNFNRAYIIVGAPSATTLTSSINCSYFINGSTTAYTLGTFNLSEAPETSGYEIAKFPFPSGSPSTGQWISLSCSSTGDSGPLNIYGIDIVYDKLNWP